MKKPKRTFTPRKTTRERLLYAQLRGFSDCLLIFEEYWREKTWKEYQRGTRLNPESDPLWKLIEKAQAKIRPVDLEWRALEQGRSEAGNKAWKKARGKRR